MVENYGFSQGSGSNTYSESGYGMSAMCVGTASSHEKMVTSQQGSPATLDQQNFYLGMTCGGQGSPFRNGSLTMPVLPAKKFRGDQTEILRCKRRVDLTQKLGYKTHPTAVARRNERERNRVKHINSTFATLRQHIPCAAKNKKMSKVETLKSAIRYINHLQQILDSQEPREGGQGGLVPLQRGATGRSVALSSPSSASSPDSDSHTRMADPYSPPMSPLSSSGSAGSPRSHPDMSPDRDYDTYDQPDDGGDLTQFVDWFCE